MSRQLLMPASSKTACMSVIAMVWKAMHGWAEVLESVESGMPRLAASETKAIHSVAQEHLAGYDLAANSITHKTNYML